MLAVGRTAQGALAELGVDAPALRHPAHGGAVLFREQLQEELRAYDFMELVLSLLGAFNAAGPPQEVPMSRFLSRVRPLLVVLALLAVPASADVYFVTLTNGTVVETARQPQQASWDPNMVLLLTEVGNWVGFPKDEVKNVRAEDPTQGFGIRISDKAIALGRAPNDLPDETRPSRSRPTTATSSYANRLLDLLEQRRTTRSSSSRSPAASRASRSATASASPAWAASAGSAAATSIRRRTPTARTRGSPSAASAGAGAPPQ